MVGFADNADALALVNLSDLMERTSGRPDVKIGIIDGPVRTEHPDLASEHLRQIRPTAPAACTEAHSMACLHGTFVAGILAGRRGSPAPAICPACTLVIRPIFTEPPPGRGQVPSATPDELVEALLECIDAGVRIVNLSVALPGGSSRGDDQLVETLNHAARRGVIVVAASGNQGTLGSSAITSHPWVIPVAACDRQGRPLSHSNIARSIGRRGLMAPGDGITSLSPDEGPLALDGTSVAAPFVTGAIALLASEFPAATASQLRLAITGVSRTRRVSPVPPLLDAAAARGALSNASWR
jgi:subtilisin family serine protease